MSNLQASSLEEKRRHSSILIPYTYYNCQLPDAFSYVPLHWHNEFELNFVRTGTGIFRIEQQEIPIYKGDIFVLQPDTLHSISTGSGTELCYDTLVFHSSMLSGAMEDRCYTEFLRPVITKQRKIITPISSKDPHYGLLKKCIQNIMRCAQAGSGKQDLLLKSELMKLLGLLDDDHKIIQNTSMNTKETDSLRCALEYISANYQEQITIEQLSQSAHLSKSYFMNLFRLMTGMGAIEYLNHFRIKAVCEILLDTDCSIAEAAFSCGFRNLSNFNRQFRKMVGISPAQYRKG
ncbi:MAG: AraC family transcriptional regulator [Butyrivibrio sp.]|nr:AraC family transcriptional regulator [Butyrivibrio sp.]